MRRNLTNCVKWLKQIQNHWCHLVDFSITYNTLDWSWGWVHCILYILPDCRLYYFIIHFILLSTLEFYLYLYLFLLFPLMLYFYFYFAWRIGTKTISPRGLINYSDSDSDYCKCVKKYDFLTVNMWNFTNPVNNNKYWSLLWRTMKRKSADSLQKRSLLILFAWEETVWPLWAALFS